MWAIEAKDEEEAKEKGEALLDQLVDDDKGCIDDAWLDDVEECTEEE